MELTRKDIDELRALLVAWKIPKVSHHVAISKIMPKLGDLLDLAEKQLKREMKELIK